MGQRLVVTIKKNQKPIMKVYYHWSAYTDSTYEELRTLWSIIKPHKDEPLDELILNIIHGVENTVDEAYKRTMSNIPTFNRSCHGGIDGGKDSDEWNYITDKYPHESFDSNPDRNCGLIAISDKGMDEMDMWAEGTAEIDLDTGMMHNNVYYPYVDKENYVYRCAQNRDGDDSDEDTRKYYSDIYDNMTCYDGDATELFHFKADDIDKVYETYRKTAGNDYCFRDKTEMAYEFIG